MASIVILYYVKEFCRKQCNKGHNCRGVQGEQTCLPCLFCSPTHNKNRAGDMCTICYTEPLIASPCIKVRTVYIMNMNMKEYRESTNKLICLTIDI